ncbi:MAG: sulfite exporter TauE/SafE family protein [Lachnospiraceae bacterium]|nr:sulfite exporter TauE/SafE family protein [Lachnospiraceae bacterium]
MQTAAVRQNFRMSSSGIFPACARSKSRRNARFSSISATSAPTYTEISCIKDGVGIDAVSGGGGLLTLPTFLLIGFPVHLVAGTNQCACLLGAVTALIRYMRGGKIYWFTAILSAVNAVIGSLLGARLNLLIPEEYLRYIMLLMLPVVAVLILVNKDFGKENRIDTLSKKQMIIRSVLIGLFLGAYIGFYGAGGGTFVLLSFAVFLKLDLVGASGNAKVCGTAATFTASLTYALSGMVVWNAVVCASVFNVAGNYLGAGLALKKGAKVIRPMFILVLILLFVRIICDMIL